MQLDQFDLLKEMKGNKTGNRDWVDEYKIIECPFDRYVVKVKLSLKNEFLGITEIKLNQSFLSQKQKNSRKGYHDVERIAAEE